MRIIKSGKDKKEKEVKVTCRCGCQFACTKKDGRSVMDRNEQAIVVKCPECKFENWLDSKLF